jgi:ABC-type thiamine transport system substrate-binding protein
VAARIDTSRLSGQERILFAVFVVTLVDTETSAALKELSHTAVTARIRCDQTFSGAWQLESLGSKFENHESDKVRFIVFEATQKAFPNPTATSRYPDLDFLPSDANALELGPDDNEECD